MADKLNLKTWAFSAIELHWNISLWQILRNTKGSLYGVNSIFATRIEGVIDNSLEAEYNGDKEKIINSINDRLSILDWDALQILFSEYIQKHNLFNSEVLNDRKHFYLSKFYSTTPTNNSDLWINDINLFDKFQLGMFCWILYWEPSNMLAEYEKKLHQQ